MSHTSAATPPTTPTDDSLYRKDYIPELDGLRGIAVLLVLWVHLPKFALGAYVADFQDKVLPPGNVGVDLFFVLSGFLITRILLVDRDRGVPLRYFLARRFLRIFPIYYLTIAVLHPRLSSLEVYACATYVSNYAFLFRSEISALEHTWSLAVEEHFYLLWPPLVAFLTPRASRRFLLWGVLPLGVLSCVWVLFLGDWQESARVLEEFCQRASNVRFFSLGLGALVAFHETTLRSYRVRAALLIAAACVVAWSLSRNGLRATGAFELLARVPATAGDSRSFMPPIQSLSIPFASVAAVMACTVFSASWWPHAALMRARPLRWIGRISYGLYLYHFPVFGTGVWGPEPSTPSGVRVAGVLVLSTGLAALSYLLFEKPLLDLGARFRGGGKSELRDRPAARGGLRSVVRGAGAIAFVAILFWTMNGGARSVVARLDSAVPVRASAPQGAARLARRATPEIVDWIEGTGTALDEFAATSGRPLGRRVAYARGVFADGDSRTGHFVSEETGAQFVDITFLRDVARELDATRSAAPFVQLAQVGGRAMTYSPDLEARLRAFPQPERRLRRILLGDALAGAALAHLTDALPIDFGPSSVREVLEATRRVEASLDENRPARFLPSTLFREGDLDQRLRWWMVGLSRTTGTTDALRALELPAGEL